MQRGRSAGRWTGGLTWLWRAGLVVALLALVGTGLVWGAAAGTAAGAAHPQNNSGGTVRLQLLAINDFHGALQSTTVAGRPAGGAAVLAAYLDRWEGEARAEGASTIRVGAGDLIGASPPISALLQDEPAIEVLGLMGLQLSSVGNHEFDDGIAELRRLQQGGCHPETGCFAGATFQYLAANVVDATSGQPILPPYRVQTVEGVPVGFIGVVLEATPTIVTPSGVAGLRFLDEAETVNRYVSELKGQGVRAIVVLIHEGGRGTVNGGPIEGVIVPIVEAMDAEVDVVASGHTHQGYWGTIAGKLVTQAFSNGTAFADIDLVLDRQTGDVVEKRARIVTTFADVAPGTTPDAEVAAVVARAADQVAPIVNRPVATAATAITRAESPAGESALGNLIADAQRATMGSQIAFMNPGGIRADVAAGEVTYGELFTVQPFGNDLVRLTLTGAQVERLLEQQWAGQPSPRILKTSGISYAWNPSAPVGDRVASSDITIGGQPLDPSATYTVTMNSFLADGGDNFTVLLEGTDRVVGPDDLDALVEYVRQLPQPFGANIEGRIRVTAAPTPSPTSVATSTPTATPTSVATGTSTPTATPTISATSTSTPTPAATRTSTPTPVSTSAASATPGGQPVVVCNGRPATIVGTTGSDVLFGTSGNDVIAGLGGGDVIYGLAGNDFICAGDGSSVLSGGNGDDFLEVGQGNSVLDGGVGVDTCIAGDGQHARLNCERTAPEATATIVPTVAAPTRTAAPTTTATPTRGTTS